MKSLLRWYFEKLPYVNFFDRIYVFVMFVFAHRRIPIKSRKLVNDYFYFLKTSSEMLDIFRQMTSDKVLVKQFVQQHCGEGLTVDTVAIFESVDEIDVSALPKPCVLKPAHSSGSVVFLKEGQTELVINDRRKLEVSLKTSPYLKARETNYKHLRHRLICEPMLPGGERIKDYKFFCYKGRPRLIQVDSERHSAHKRNIYTIEWNPLPFKYNYPIGEWESVPSSLLEMIRVAELLAQPFEFVRVDFFIVENKFFVGELTHCPESAHGRFEDLESERLFSDFLFCSGLKN